MCKRIIVAFMCFGMLVMATGCTGPLVEIPTAHVGKLSDKTGLLPGILTPCKFRLTAQPFPGSIGNSLILAEASDYSKGETMEIFMPKDQLNLTVSVKGTYSVSGNQKNVDKVFAKIPAQLIGDRVSIIKMTSIYNTYAQPVIKETVRSFITNYSIDEVMMNRDTIGRDLTKAVNDKLKMTPIKASYFGLANIQPPKVIIDAQESAKKREIAIKEADNEKMVSLKKAEGALEIAVKQQEVDLKEAETQVLVNKKLTEGVNQAFVTQRALKVMAKLAASDNKVFFIPMEAMKNPAMMVGMMQEANK